MKPANRGGCSTRQRRLRLPVPIDCIPTLRPAREVRSPIISRRSIRTYLKQLWKRFPLRFVSAIHNTHGFCGGSFQPSINPATGLPMAGAVDAAGNPYGFGSRGVSGGQPIHLSRHTSCQIDLCDMPPFHSDWDEPKVTLDSIERRWGTDHNF